MMKSSPKMGSLRGNLRHGLHPCCSLKLQLDTSLHRSMIMMRMRRMEKVSAKILGRKRQPGIVAAANTSRDGAIVRGPQPYHRVM